MSDTDKTGPIKVQSNKQMFYVVDNQQEPIVGGINAAGQLRTIANRKVRRSAGALKVLARHLRGDSDVSAVEVDFVPISAERRHITRTAPERVNGLRRQRRRQAFATT